MLIRTASVVKICIIIIIINSRSYSSSRGGPTGKQSPPPGRWLRIRKKVVQTAY